MNMIPRLNFVTAKLELDNDFFKALPLKRLTEWQMSPNGVKYFQCGEYLYFSNIGLNLNHYQSTGEIKLSGISNETLKHISLYYENDFDNRTQYLKSLHEQYELPLQYIIELANTLGHSEDFDGLITTLDSI